MSRAVAHIDWRRCAVQALMWSTMQVVTFNFGYLAFITEYEPRWVPVYVVLMIATWFVFAVLLAASAQWVEGRWPWPAVGALALVECGFTILQRDFSILLQFMLGLEAHRGLNPYPTFAWVAYVGGLPFFAYCLLVQRSVRVRGLLGRAELERARTASLLGQAQADALEGRIDPALLQRALTALQTAYAGNRAQAETLLDALVDFLRQAMPAIRSGRSCLRDELALLRRHAALVHSIDGERRLCSLEIEATATDLGFPPLLLVPLVEALARAHAGTQALRVRLAAERTALRLEFDAQPAGTWLDETLLQRLEHALRSTPDTAGARIEVGGSRALTLWLPLPPAPENEDHEHPRLQVA